MLRGRTSRLCIGLLGGLGEGEWDHLLEGCFFWGRLGADRLYREQLLKLLTKGDNNLADDTELYARGQDYLERSQDIIGSVVGYVPFVGYVTILLSEHPWLKTVMLGIMGVMVVLQRE